MSNAYRSPKLQPWHFDRSAVVYVRQSTPQQVLEHQESTARQYALADRAVAFGWPRDHVLVIDDDLGQSGQSAEGRLGFQRGGVEALIEWLELHPDARLIVINTLARIRGKTNGKQMGHIRMALT